MVALLFGARVAFVRAWRRGTSRPRDHRELRLDIITSLNLNITGSLPARVGTTRAMPQIMALEAMPNFSSALQLAKTSDKPSAACPAHATADLIQ